MTEQKAQQPQQPQQPEQPRQRRQIATDVAMKAPKMGREGIAAALRAHDEGKKVAYSFINCGYDEIIRAMEIVPFWVENFAGVCAAKRDAERFLQKANSENFSRSLCTYALCGLGFDAWRKELHTLHQIGNAYLEIREFDDGQMPPNPPWGGQAKPDMMLGSGQMICDPRYKWFQAEQYYMPDVPVHIVDLPWPAYDPDMKPGEYEPYYVKYCVKEFKGLVEFLEKQTGKKMDWDKLSALVDLGDRTWNLIHETYELRRAVPTPMGTGDAMNTMVPIVFRQGTQDSYDIFKELNDELQRKIANKEAAVPDEKYRLLWGGGLPSWFALTDFDYFASKGASFPAETTYRCLEPTYNLNLPKTSDPLEHLAWRWVRLWSYWFDRARKRPGSHPDVERLIKYIEDYKIDGVVMHEAFSCRSWHPGLIWQLNILKKVYHDIPSLVLESDIVDINSYSEVDTKKKIDAFIETLESAKG